MSLQLLREYLKLVFESEDSFIKRGATSDAWRANRDEAFEDDVEALVGEPEFKNVETFVAAKLDNDEYSFNAVELQALARRADEEKLGHDVGLASPLTTKSIKQSLVDDFGFKFDPRQPAKHFRGGMSSSHGSHPFAGSGGGGSGFGSDFGGGTFTSYGGGPGAMGSGEAWEKDSKKNLRMGAGKRK